MRILAIETSCDETAISVVECSEGFSKPKFKILSNVVASQIKIHAKWGGVVPNLAKREHLKNLPVVLKKALGKIKIKDIDLIAVTIGPGLEPALWTGINFARDLNKVWDKPIIGINHMEGHIVASLLNSKIKYQKSKLWKFPVMALLVSGGHTELVLIKNWLKYKIIGQTRDDAAGEAFDKVAKMLKLPYPGGPQVAKLAEKFKFQDSSFKINLPRPMINSKDYDFSFSGLKTAVLYKLKELGIMNKELKIAICHEFQQAVIDVLIAKTIRAAKEYKVKSIIAGGGVIANNELRKQLNETIEKNIPNTKFLIPDTKFTTDNAAMISVAAYFRALKKPFGKLRASPQSLKANGNLILK
ncbi:tRNA (adenosine(37)-N6)-threonylcarbamoyltransferase complex transferase subunit TsaD [Patescibacteria group bacterium]|nr:tRNA (adenosine(37)-N6)-threonylcarbamoyltransferase complex transferase subunit TsaD [Patescibacteria group bacterium]